MAKAEMNVTVNINWGDPAFAPIAEVISKMVAAREKYTQEHDDSQGSGHLVNEAVQRLTHMGEFPTDDAVKDEITTAIALLFHAHAAIERAQKVTTIALTDGTTVTLPTELAEATNGDVCLEQGCGLIRTDEPEYSAIQPMTGQPLGWYNGDDGSFCPKHIAAMMLGNRKPYSYCLPGGSVEIALP
jgi:hypothetical protein